VTSIMSEELPAEDLLVRVARQDVAAMSELYDRYAPRVYGLMARIFSSRDTAEEVLREVFARLWSESPTLSREGGSVAAWLVFTARGMAMDRLRAERRNALKAAAQGGPTAKAAKASTPGPRKSKTTAAAPSPAKSLSAKSEGGKSRPADGAGVAPRDIVPSAWLPLPKEIALIDSRLVLLYKVIDQLPKPQRQALELAVFGGLSESEIATEVGEPLGKVQRSLRAAVTFVKHRRRAVCGTWAANI